MIQKKHNLKALAQQLCQAFKKKTGYDCGHVHFMYRGKRDHLILVCDKGRIENILAKNEECEKGHYIEWNESEFSRHSPVRAFLKSFDQIDKIIIDINHPFMHGSWNSFDEFLSWLNEASK